MGKQRRYAFAGRNDVVMYNIEKELQKKELKSYKNSKEFKAGECEMCAGGSLLIEDLPPIDRQENPGIEIYRKVDIKVYIRFWSYLKLPKLNLWKIIEKILETLKKIKKK